MMDGLISEMPDLIVDLVKWVISSSAESSVLSSIGAFLTMRKLSLLSATLYFLSFSFRRFINNIAPTIATRTNKIATTMPIIIPTSGPLDASSALLTVGT